MCLRALGFLHRKVWNSCVEPAREYLQRTASLHSFGTSYATYEENQCQGVGRKSKALLNSSLTFAANVFPLPMRVLDMLHATFQVGPAVPCRYVFCRSEFFRMPYTDPEYLTRRVLVGGVFS